jgi:hypothetical protein
MSVFLVSLSLDLFDHHIQEFLSVPLHVDFSTTLRVGLQWRLVDWICCSYHNSWGVIGFIPCGIQARLPQLTKFMSELCLVCEADSNWGWCEVASA